MARVWVTCPICGNVEVSADAVRLKLGYGDEVGHSTYFFDCPKCKEHVTKPANGTAIRLLLKAGVPFANLGMPAEALEEHTGPPITADDVLDFHELLERRDWFNELVLFGPYQT